MGVKIWNDGKPVDSQRCASGCSAQTDYNPRHLPTDGSAPKPCRFFSKYVRISKPAPSELPINRHLRLKHEQDIAKPVLHSVHADLGQFVRDQNWPLSRLQQIHDFILLLVLQLNRSGRLQEGQVVVFIISNSLYLVWNV
jgi:hypothetical protein